MQRIATRLGTVAAAAAVVVGAIVVPTAADAASAYSCANNYRVKTTSVASGSGAVQHIWINGSASDGRVFDPGAGTKVGYSTYKSTTRTSYATNGSIAVSSFSTSCYN